MSADAGRGPPPQWARDEALEITMYLAAAIQRARLRALSEATEIVQNEIEETRMQEGSLAAHRRHALREVREAIERLEPQLERREPHV